MSAVPLLITERERAALPTTLEEWWAIYDAIAQYVDNEEEVEGAESSPRLRAARTVRERFDAALAKLAGE